MRIKLGYPLLVRHVADMCNALLIMADGSDCLQAVTHLVTDSREVMPGDMFVALKTQKDDGHRYIQEAVKRGAAVILCIRAYAHAACEACRILVRDTTEALACFARAFSMTIPHKTIAITGSVGKTTTRRFMVSVLAEHHRVHESPHNYNNLLGISLLLLSMPQKTEYLVAECGTSAPGEIEVLSNLLCPDYAIVTNVGISHIEHFTSQAAICKEKLSIITGNRACRLFCCAEDEHLQNHAPDNTAFVSVSEKEVAYACENIHEDIYGISFTIKTPTRRLTHMHIPTIGRHTLSCALLAIAVGDAIGLRDEEMRHGLLTYQAEEMRQVLMHAGNITYLFDAYNACPASMRAAFYTTRILQTHKRGGCVLVLGDMYELGNMTQQSHHEIGSLLPETGAHDVVLWGNYAPYYEESALAAGFPSEQLHVYQKETDVKTVADQVAASTMPFDTILIKGSRGMRMERLLPYLYHT